MTPEEKKAQTDRIMKERVRNRWESLPRYIRRAFKSKNKLYIEKAIKKALAEGLTVEDLTWIEEPQQEEQPNV